MQELFAQRFLGQLQTGTVAERAEVVRFLGEIYNESPPGSPMQADLAIALVAVLDDPSPHVRGALSQTVASCAHLPLTVLLGLSEDAPEIAAPVLQNNPSLSEAWLIDLVGSGLEGHRIAIVGRPHIGVGLSAAIAALAEPGVCCALLRNSGAHIGPSALEAMVERHASNADLRTLLLRRADLPVALRRTLIETLTESLATHVVTHNLMPANRAKRVFADAEEQALIEVSDHVRPDEMIDFAAQLHQDGAITVPMLLRALIDGRASFVEAALAVTADMPVKRVRAVVQHGGRGLGSLYRRCGLDPLGQSVMTIALQLDVERRSQDSRGGMSRRQFLEVLLGRYEAACENQLDPYLAMLTRAYANEARRAVRQSVGNHRHIPAAPAITAA
jgi:uncharacterized protein (DUF2336 family)